MKPTGQRFLTRRDALKALAALAAGAAIPKGLEVPHRLPEADKLVVNPAWETAQFELYLIAQKPLYDKLILE